MTPPYYPQETDFSCAVACLRMVLAAYGIIKSETELRVLCDCTICRRRAEQADPDALARAVAAMTHRTPEEIAAAQARAQQEFQPEHVLPSGASVIEAVFGKWPGTETDEEVYQALEKLS